MNGDQVDFTIEAELVAGAQLLAAHGADLAVDGNFAVQNQLLGLAAGVDDVGVLHGVLQLDELSGDHHGGNVFFSLNDNFHNFNLPNHDVIASQCAHWRGNPLQLQEALVQVLPGRIFTDDQFLFSFAIPSFDLLFPL